MFADPGRFQFIHIGEPIGIKTLLIAFDDEGTHLRAVAIVVRVEHTLLTSQESLRQRIEDARCSKPGKMIGEVIHARLECRLIAPTQQRIETICAYHQVGIGFHFCNRVRGMLKAHFDAKLARPLLQQLQ